ncbi:MAG: preprotein translocase subunit YajC [Novosphingobium sp.]
MALPAHAQSIGYGGGGSGASSGAAANEGSGDSGTSGKEKPKRGKRGGGTGRISVDPYIEAGQVVAARLSPGSETLTYTMLAAGVDASINGRNNAGSVSLRYERRFGYGRADDSDTISGMARASVAVVPQTLRIEAGVMAQRTRVESNGGAVVGGLDGLGNTSNVYSLYAGPVLSTHAGDVKLDASYRIGYTKVTKPDALTITPGSEPVDVFDSSVVHSAEIHAGTRPGEVLPVGLGAGAGYYQEDISNLDQRVRDFHARADVTVPVGRSVALVGGIGYEDVEISSRDAVLVGGVPVVGSDGRLVTDQSAPRQIAYEASGLIWDVGVMWKPSPRTSLEAHVGRRYGTMSYFGTFGWAPSRRQSVNVAVYHNVAGFGGQVNRALANLPTQFQSIRNPLTGDLTGCVASLEAGSCLGGALGSVRSSTFRARGIAATYGLDLGRITTGVGVGYDRRTFFAAPGTILAAANGLVDENYWLAAYLDAQLDQRSSLSTNIYANWFHSGFAGSGNASALGATVAYHRSLTNRLSGTVALGIDGINRQYEDDYWTASALAGVRYRF